MKDSTLNIWKKLQDKDYFKHHRCHNFVPTKPKTIDEKDIKDKIVVEIGGGYGRETAYISQIAKKVYFVEVSQKILNEAKGYITKYGNITKIDFILTENYKSQVPDNIDYVYAFRVFQHITPQQVKDYINTFYNKLKIGGKIHIDFAIGTAKQWKKDKEPRVHYNMTEIVKFFDKFKIETNIETISNRKLKHCYITGTKI